MSKISFKGTKLPYRKTLPTISNRKYFLECGKLAFLIRRLLGREGKSNE